MPNQPPVFTNYSERLILTDKEDVSYNCTVYYTIEDYFRPSRTHITINDIDIEQEINDETERLLRRKAKLWIEDNILGHE